MTTQHDIFTDTEGQDSCGQDSKARISATINVTEARFFAKSYGKVLRNAHKVAYSEDDLRHFWDALQYCRWVILKSRLKRAEAVAE